MSNDERDKDEIIAQLREENRLQAERIKLLEEKIDYLIKVIHGSRSEQLDANQLELLLNPDAAKKPDAAESADPGPVAEEPGTRQRKRSARKPRLPEHIPTEEVVLIPDEVQADPRAYRKVGEKRCEKLEVTPTRFTRRVIIRPTFVKKGEPVPQWLTAPAPPSLLEGSMLTPSLAAHILCSKFCDHLPFYRQEQIMARRHGIHIPRNTMCHWTDASTQTLEPLYKLLAGDIRASHEISVDETPVDYLPLEDKGSKRGYFWVYHSANVGVLYDWQIGRGHECLNTILDPDAGSDRSSCRPAFNGLLQCDGYSAYPTWAAKHDGVVLAGCWAHARRKFFEALQHSGDAAVILKIIGQIYSNEHRLRARIMASGHPPGAIKYLRRKHHAKLLQNLRAKLLELKPRHLPKSSMGKAIGYALNQWRALSTAYKHAAALDNNICENAVRPLKLGAKNWLFVGNEDTGWRSAVIYTFIENIRREGLDPYAYLKWLFEKLPLMSNQDDLRLLLPKAWIDRQRGETKKDSAVSAQVAA